eukprot:1623982-Pleurochrysis_carterae.AAC.1
MHRVSVTGSPRERRKYSRGAGFSSVCGGGAVESAAGCGMATAPTSSEGGEGVEGTVFGSDVLEWKRDVWS